MTVICVLHASILYIGEFDEYILMLCYCVLVQVCDGYNDCINSEDESNCATT